MEERRRGCKRGDGRDMVTWSELGYLTQHNAGERMDTEWLAHAIENTCPVQKGPVFEDKGSLSRSRAAHSRVMTNRVRAFLRISKAPSFLNAALPGGKLHSGVMVDDLPMCAPLLPPLVLQSTESCRQVRLSCSDADCIGESLAEGACSGGCIGRNTVRRLEMALAEGACSGGVGI